MTDSPFQTMIREREAKPQLVKNSEPQDDAARPDGYEAVRRIRSFHFADVVFRLHTRAPHAFPWTHLRGWIGDEAGKRLSFIWPEAVIMLSGRHLDLLEEDILRRIVAEFRQVAPGDAASLLPGVPVIVGMEITMLDAAGPGG